VIYVGIDDTDIVGSPGTNQLARRIVRRLGPVAKGAIVCRHQLFFDARVPFTSGNGSASIQLPHGDRIPRDALIATIREEMRAFFVEGSDPGLAVAAGATDGMNGFAARAKTCVVTPADAHTAVERSGCYLEGLGGTNQGIIGAVAAVALVASGDDGRVIHLHDWPWPDPMNGVQPVAALHNRGIAKICTLSGAECTADAIDVGKHLRPNWRGGRVVLFAEPPDEIGSPWRAIRLDGRE